MDKDRAVSATNWNNTLLTRIDCKFPNDTSTGASAPLLPGVMVRPREGLPNQMAGSEYKFCVSSYGTKIPQIPHFCVSFVPEILEFA
eukprot:587533-Rhodomonas_salina.1